MKKNFIFCGLLGWILEIFYTAFQSFRKRQRKLYAVTSLWMFPIYGSAAFFSPLMKLIKKLPVLLRGLLYTGGIFLTEYCFGRILMKYDCCPWNYEKSRFQIKKVIRLDFAPLWFLTGLLLEKIVLKKESDRSEIPF